MASLLIVFIVDQSLFRRMMVVINNLLLQGVFLLMLWYWIEDPKKLQTIPKGNQNQTGI